MATWDRRPPAATAKVQAAALRAQVVDAVAPFSPWWRDRLKALGRTAASVSTPDGLAELPAAGERDVCPDGDPRGAAALVLQAGESGWALHAEGPRLRAGLARRLVRPRSYAAMVEADTRPTSFVWAGLGLDLPVASTRSDLDVVARAGARLWQVLGLTRADVAVSGLPLLRTAASQALELGALGAGAPLLAPGPDGVAQALELVPATVLALPSTTAAAVVDGLDPSGLAALTTLLLVGAPTPAERTAAADALTRAGSGAQVLAVHVADGHRLAWAECREGGERAGLHTYPDLELLQLVDAETGERAGDDGRRELVVTQLGLRGTALLRWRTGDLVDDLTTAPCPGCGRTVPRVLGVRRAALVPVLDLLEGPTAVDLRAVAGALLGRPDVDDWRLDLRPGERGDADRLVVHLAVQADADAAAVAVEVAEEVEALTGALPTQVVAPDDGVLPPRSAGSRVLLRG